MKTNKPGDNVKLANQGTSARAVLLLLSAILLLALAALPVSAQSSFSNAVMSLNPAGYWPLQETDAPAAATIETNYGSLGALGNAYYVATNMSQATLGSGGALTNSGDNDPSVYLSGASLNGGSLDYLFVPRVAPEVTFKPPFTLECWYMAASDASSGFGDLIGEGGSGLNSAADAGSAGGVRLSYGGGSTPNIQFYIFTGSGQTRRQVATPTGTMLPLGSWHYVVATYDGSTALVYIDGVQQVSGTWPMNIDTWSPLTIGAGFWRHQGYASSWVKGNEDEVAVYTNVLTATQITNHWLAATTSGSNYMQTVLNDSPVMYYRMNATTYTNVPAASCPVAANYGSAPVSGAYVSGTRPGVVAGPSILGAPGAVASPISGINSCIDGGYDAAFDPAGTQPFTAACWFRGHPADQRPIQALMSQGTNWELMVSGANGTVSLVSGAGSVASTGVLNDGNWHFVVGVYDGANLQLYVDGMLNNSATASGSLTGDSGHNFYLGGNAAYPFVDGKSQQYFAGDLAEAAYFTNALTAGQVQQLYSTTIAPPQIEQQPAAVNNKAAGQTNVLSVTVVGGAPLVYQWFFNTTSNYSGASALSDGPTGSGSVVSGATTRELTITNLQDGDNGYYYVTVTNDYGSVTSIVSQLQVFTAPIILSQSPASDFSLCAGHDYSLSVRVKGAQPLSYQWFTNGVADTTAGTTSTYALTGVQLDMSGTTFQCVITNALGSATNTLVTMTVLQGPTSAYATSVLDLNPAGYWPLHEVAPAAPGDIETNYGTLGVLGNAYYPDFEVDNGAFIRQWDGPLANGASKAVYFTNPNSNNGGSTNSLFVPHTSPLTALHIPFTIEMWFMFTNLPTLSFQNDIIAQGNASRLGGFRVYYQHASSTNESNPGFNLLLYNNTKANQGFQVTVGAFPTNVWHYLVYTVDSNRLATGYLDGTTRWSTPSRTVPAGRYDPDPYDPLTIGNGMGNQRAINGLISEVAIYTNSLNVEQISNHWDIGTDALAGANAYFDAVTNDNPIIYYRMDSAPYTAPNSGTWPVATNYGLAGVGGVYSPGTEPGAVAGTDYNEYPLNAAGLNVAPLSGVSSYVNVGNAAAYNPTGTNSFTVAAIFRGNPADTNRAQMIVGHGTNSWELGLTQNGYIVFNSGTDSANVVATGSAAGDLVSTMRAGEDGHWHLVVAVHDGTTNVLYVDGVADSSNVVAADNVGNSLDLMIGSDPCYTYNPIDWAYCAPPLGVGAQFAGQVCDVAFFTSALTPAQVQSLYVASGREQPPVVANIVTNLVASGFTAKFAIADLRAAAGWSDPNGDPVTFVGAGPTSALGKSVTSDATYIYYNALATNEDSFIYTITDGTLTANGTVYLEPVAGAGVSIETPGTDVNGNPTFSGQGIPSYQYGVESTTNLATGPWLEAGTVTAGTNGSWSFTDLSQTNPVTIFYRLYYPDNPSNPPQ